MPLHKPTRGGRARIRRGSARLRIPILANIPVFVAVAAPLPQSGAISTIEGGLSVNIQREKRERLERSFREQVERWKFDTQHWSSVTKMIAHPSYLRIIGLAGESTENEIERWLLQELKDDPDYWFDALAALAGERENPVGPQDDFDGSVNAWLEWGRKKGYLAP